MEEFGFESFEFSDRVLRIEIFPNDCLDFTLNLFEAGSSSNAATSVKVRTLSISSSILATKSPFFYKLFKNGMKESQERNFILRINVSEEISLMDVLNFMYCYKLRATTIPELLQVMIVADKFEVTSCMRYCCDLLLKLPMSLELAREYLNLPPDQSIQPLKDAANKYKSEVYSLHENAISLSMSDIEILLASDELRVQSEDDVLDFIYRWSSSNAIEYEQSINSLCVRFLRFCYLSFDTLNQLMASRYSDKMSAKVLEGLSFKTGLTYSSQQQQQQQQQQKQRIYELRPLRSTHIQYSDPHRIVFLDLKRDECVGLFPDKRIASENFGFDVDEFRSYFCLKVRCRKDEQGSVKLGVYVHTWCEYVGDYYDVEFELAVMMKMNLNTEYKLLWRSGFIGWEIEWSDFVAEDSPYFIDDIVRFRAEVEIKPRRPVIQLQPECLCDCLEANLLNLE